MIRLILVLTVFLGLSCVSDFQQNELIVCGGKEVFIIDTEDPAKEKIWSWTAAESDGIPQKYKGSFNSTDECKSIKNGKEILIASSGGGVALVRRADKKVLFYGYVRNAHSAEILPGNRIAVAGSVGGDCLTVFEVGKPDQPLYSTSLPKGHGAVWDVKRKLLYALAYEHLHIYQLKNWESSKPELTLNKKIRLPDIWGHDLFELPGSEKLILTTEHHSWFFDRADNSIAPFKAIYDLKDVKGVSPNPVNGKTVYTKGDGGHWWTDTIRFLDGSEFKLPGERIYKVRWVRN